jgi:FAD/FMN-containing dehydrogenase
MNRGFPPGRPDNTVRPDSNSSGLRASRSRRLPGLTYGRQAHTGAPPSIEAGEKIIRPLRDYGPPLVDLFKPTPYNEAQKMADFLWPPGLHSYWKSSYVETLSDAAIEVVADFFSRVPSKQTVIVLEHNGNGAFERVPESATAFGHRRWPYNFVVTSAWADVRDSEGNIAWTREFFEAMSPFLAKTAYLNYLGADAQDRIVAAFGSAKYERLAALKLKYDPANLFRMNQNISPAAAGGVAVASLTGSAEI